VRYFWDTLPNLLSATPEAESAPPHLSEAQRQIQTATEGTLGAKFFVAEVNSQCDPNSSPNG